MSLSARMGHGTLVQAVRAATERFKDAEAAQAAGYGLFMGCVSGPQEGAMASTSPTATWSATARLWDVQTGQELRRFAGHTDDVRYVAFSPDGKYILTASQDGTTRLWLTDLQDMIHAVCAVLTRDLSAAQRADAV